MNGRYHGKVALVTGAASGLGAATVARLTAEGAMVAGLDLTPAEAPLALTADVREESQVRDAVAAVLDWAGRLDLLANVASLAGVRGWRDTPLKHGLAPVPEADPPIAYLGSAEARFATGAVLRLDGGAGA